MKYDDASWHYGGDFPDDLPDEAGGTHIGMFVAWCVLNGLGGDIHTEDPEEIADLKNRKITPGAWFLAACDGKFTDEDLSPEGNSFAQRYYEGDSAKYMDAYTLISDEDQESLYHTPDTWATYDALSGFIANAYENPPRKRRLP